MPSSYFTDEFQLSDGLTYPIGIGGGEPAPVLEAGNPKGDIWQAFLFPAITGGRGTVSNNGQSLNVAVNGQPVGIFWPIPFDNPAVQFTVGPNVPVGNEYALWVSLQGNSASTNGYVVTLKINEAGKAIMIINRVTNGAFHALTGEAVVTFLQGDTWKFRNQEGSLSVYRGNKKEQGIQDYVYGTGFTAVSIATAAIPAGVTLIAKGSGDNGVSVGRAQVVKFKEEINFSNKEGGGLEGSYQSPPCFLSYGPQITPPVGTVLSLEEVRAEVTPVFYGSTLNGLISQAEVQAYGNEINLTLGPVFFVVIRDPFQFLNQPRSVPYEWPKGMYLPGFHGVGIIERLEIIPARKLSLQFSSHEATIKFGLVEDPIQPATVNKIFNPAVNISGGRVLGFGIESTPAVQENASAPHIAQRYQHYLEVRAAARYRIFELGERSS